MRQFIRDCPEYPLARRGCATKNRYRCGAGSVPAVAGGWFLPAGPACFQSIGRCRKGGLHQSFVDAAKAWLALRRGPAASPSSTLKTPAHRRCVFVSRIPAFIQLNYPALQVEPAGDGGFPEVHWGGPRRVDRFSSRNLLGEFDGYPMWPWFSEFMGGIRFARLHRDVCLGRVTVEAPFAPRDEGRGRAVSPSTTRNGTPTTNRRGPTCTCWRVLTRRRYSPPSSTTMGDHPVVWTNERMKARNVYISDGPSWGAVSEPRLYEDFSQLDSMGGRPMKRAQALRLALAVALLGCRAGAASGPQPPLRVLAFCSTHVEGDHVEFALEALKFYRRRRRTATSLSPQKLGRSEREAPGGRAGRIVAETIPPHAARQRAAFENYMEKGGGWIGFHAAAYNDSSTRWPWFVQFLG